MMKLKKNFGVWSKGMTPTFEVVNIGSIPISPKKYKV